MRINEIVQEGILDALKFVGRAAYQAAGGQVDKNSPAISRANLEYVRKQLGAEIYSKFYNELIRLGLVRRGVLADPNKIGDINEMAVQFLKQAYSAYIVTPERLYALNNKIESEFPYVIDPTLNDPIPLNNFQAKFLEINAYYLKMLQDVESTTSANIKTIIVQLASGINNSIPPDLKDKIKTFLNDMATKPLSSITFPFSNEAGVKPIIQSLISAGTITQDQIKLYDETIKAIINLKQQEKLNVDLVKDFESKITP